MPGNAPPCILVVEDDEDIRELVWARISAKGYRVLTAGDGEEGYAILKKEKPDLVVCDVIMPKLDGIGLCKRARGEGDNTPFIFLSAKGSPNDIVEVLQAGADDYVVKPFDAGELVARIHVKLRHF